MRIERTGIRWLVIGLVLLVTALSTQADEIDLATVSTSQIGADLGALVIVNVHRDADLVGEAVIEYDAANNKLYLLDWDFDPAYFNYSASILGVTGLGGMYLSVNATMDPDAQPPTSNIGPTGEVAFNVPMRFSGSLGTSSIPLHWADLPASVSGEFFCEDFAQWVSSYSTILNVDDGYSRDKVVAMTGLFNLDVATGRYSLSLAGSTDWFLWPCGPFSTFYRVDVFLDPQLEGGDIDGDGVFEDMDNCPEDTNSGQEDGDVDGIGDICDACPNDFLNDGDGDGLCASVDNCPNFPNAGQEDLDGDGTGDPCDWDTDGDGVDNVALSNGPQATYVYDNCPLTPNPGQENSDSDPIGDACDNCDFDANALQQDLDSDGTGDVCDPCTQPYTKLTPGDLLVADRTADPAANGPGAVLLVDPDTGATSVYADSASFGALDSIAIGADGSLLLIDDAVSGLVAGPVSALLRLDPSSCAVTTTGWGPAWIDADDLQVDPRGGVLVADEGAGEIFRVDGTSLSGARATGSALTAPDALGTIPRDPSLFLTDLDHGSVELMSYDPATGSMTTINPGFFSDIEAIIPDDAGGLFVLNVKSSKEIDRVELPSGNTTQHAWHPSWNTPTDLALGEDEVVFMSDAGDGGRIAPTIEKMIGPGAVQTLSSDPVLDEPRGLAVVGLPYIGVEITEENNPSVAYNSLRDEYFVVWDEGGYLHGRLVQPDGRVSRGTFGGPGIVWGTDPVVAHQVHTDPSGPTTSGRYVVAWYSPPAGGSGPNVGVIVLDDDLVMTQWHYEILSAPLTGIDVVARPSIGSGNPQAFLVVWSADFALSSTAVRVDGTVNASVLWWPNYFGRKPSAAYDTDDDEFLVVAEWNGYLTASRVIGQSPAGPQVYLTGDPGAADGVTEVDVAYNTTSREYLVVWKEDRFEPEEIFGLRLDPLVNPVGGDFIIDGYTATTSFTGKPSRRPAVDVLAGSGDWIVAYEETWRNLTINEPTRAFGRRIDAAGAVGPEFSLMPYGQNYNVAIATHDSREELMLVAEHKPRPLVLDQDIWGRLMLDTDGDGRLDIEDNCAWMANARQTDADADGAGDVCDPFPNDAGNDIDNDGIGAEADNCATTPNGTGFGTCVAGALGATCAANNECGAGGVCSLNQDDLDFDGIGDACDPDQDGDGVDNSLDCNDRESTVFPGAAEACDGVDNNCNGVIDDLTPQPVYGMTVAVDELSWGMINGASSYDVISGDLSKLRTNGWPASSVSCERDDLTDTALAHSNLPNPGAGMWFLVRPNVACNAGTYDSGSPAQAGSRDPYIAASGDACP